ncbi:bifunctional Peptidase C1A [Babesia duncani]|uniref:Bifunctional Peptidase C1A n=1 Tax=Babesia duncani TaxID=323732 RepID=A0AAD9PKI7_9APIC|nr:bifunctional Peptidase C1A [Babesia duncani]KAK2196537.1 bifunctional Peptidase C1A [Babesia duncani]
MSEDNGRMAVTNVRVLEGSTSEIYAQQDQNKLNEPGNTGKQTKGHDKQELFDTKINKPTDYSNDEEKPQKGKTKSPLARFAIWKHGRDEYSKGNKNPSISSNKEYDNPEVMEQTNPAVINEHMAGPILTCKEVFIKCGLSGLQRDMWKRCIKCGEDKYTIEDCSKYYSFLETLVVEDVPTRDGLTPIPVKPKVGPDELIDAFEYTAAHDRRQDKYCNEDNCIRLDDPKSCISNLPAQDQKKCGTCWIFANTLHLEILICMEDVESKFVRTFSEMYMASCVSLMSHNACKGGNDFFFGKMLDHIKYWPSKHDLDYKLPLDETCPKWEKEWMNELPDLNLLPVGKDSLNSFPGYIFVKTEDFYPDKMEEMITLIKEMIREKGSVLVSMHGSTVLDESYQGDDVISLCQFTRGVHMMVIIGYGTYQKRLPGRRGYAKGRYWQIRNSWGSHWGNNGNFKLDMDGPRGCNGRVFQYVSCLNILIKKQKGWPKPGFVPPPIDKAIAQGKMNVRAMKITLEGQVYTRRNSAWVNLREKGTWCRSTRHSLLSHAFIERFGQNETIDFSFIQESYSNRNDIEKDDESDKSKRHHEEGREIQHQQSPLVMFANWMRQREKYSFSVQHPEDSKVDIDKRLPTLTHDDRVNDAGSNNATMTKLTCKDIYIKCALSGLIRFLCEECVKCAIRRYINAECSPDSHILKTLVVEDVPTRDGLTPIPVKPKVGPDELIDAFEYTAAHDRRQDKYCNEDNCIRLDDPKSCISNLPAQDQKKCGTCWIFANTLHLEILICMEDGKSKFVRTFSEMYMASCASLMNINACRGGNTFDFSKMLDHIKYWPSKHDLKYKLPLPKTCPKWQKGWINSLPELRMLPPGPNSINSFPGYIMVRLHFNNNYLKAKNR